MQELLRLVFAHWMAFAQWNFAPKWYYRRTDHASLGAHSVSLSISSHL